MLGGGWRRCLRWGLLRWPRFRLALPLRNKEGGLSWGQQGMLRRRRVQRFKVRLRARRRALLRSQGSPARADAGHTTLREQLRIAARDPSYLLLNIRFFTCGFHVAFLVTHFPGEIQNCGLMPSVAAGSLAIIGLFNVAGSVGAGMLGQRFRMKYLLALIYAAGAEVKVRRLRPRNSRASLIDHASEKCLLAAVAGGEDQKAGAAGQRR